MNAGQTRWTLVGQGLAGTCLAWELWNRGAAFSLVDSERGGSSRVAAGLVNPVTGKNFEPSSRIGEFLPEALGFYHQVEQQLGKTLWHPLPVLRLADTDKEWHKMVAKSTRPEVARWLANAGAPVTVAGWAGALEVTGGGRLDTRTFLDESREFFRQLGCYQKAEIPADHPAGNRIWCEGAVGLIRGRFGPHRCAKGEILTISTDGWDESRIRVGAGGWLVPLGNGRFKAGSTYEWNDLNNTPSTVGGARVGAIIRRLGGADFEVIAHEAGVRPILRRSEPLIGPIGDADWMFNALGSKGSLYAPGMARRLARWLTEGIEPEPEVDFRNFSENQS